MTETVLVWPTKEHYNIAIERMEQTVFDKEISKGKLHVDQIGIKHIGGGRLYVCIYRVDNWIIRCFCASADRNPPKDIQMRYEQISAYCLRNQGTVAALLPIWYIPRGIEVEYIENSIIEKTETLPIVKMPYFEGISLGSFIAEKHTNRDLMQQLGDIWLRTIRELENANIAHGDLDLTNVLIRQEGNTLILKLIDYDNMWIPALKDLKQTEVGHEAFQHPKLRSSKRRPYDAQMDRFSAMVIYISIRALQNAPHLYDEYGADEITRLLFSPNDYKAEAQGLTGRIAQLRALHIYGLESCLNELSEALRNGTMPRSITELVALTTPPSPIPPKRISKLLRPSTPSPSPTPSPEPDPSSVNQKIVRTLWDQKEYLKDPTLPLVPTPNQLLTSPPTPEPVVPEPVQPSGPIQASPQPVSSINGKPRNNKLNGANRSVLLRNIIIVAIIILVVIAVLWLTLYHPSTQHHGTVLSGSQWIHTILVLYAPNLET